MDEVNYVARQHLTFGDTVITPGEAVPVEDGRRYDLMEMAGQIVRANGAPTAARTGDLPEDFPGLKALRAAGYTTYESLKPLFVAALENLKGVGRKTAEEIHEAL